MWPRQSENYDYRGAERPPQEPEGKLTKRERNLTRPHTLFSKATESEESVELVGKAQRAVGGREEDITSQRPSRGDQSRGKRRSKRKAVALPEGLEGKQRCLWPRQSENYDRGAERPPQEGKLTKRTSAT